MLCPRCGLESRRYGNTATGRQRFYCPECQRTFCEARHQPLGAMRLPMDKAVSALRMLLEGNSIRATERLTGVNRNTIMALIVQVGERYELFLETVIAAVPCESIQCDEVWSFVHCKEKTRLRNGYAEDTGDCYTWTALERSTKLLLAYAVGKRDNQTAMTFVQRLRNATSGSFQIDTDGLNLYKTTIPLAFGWNQDHAQVVKIFGAPTDGAARYSPSEIAGMHVEVGGGAPDLDTACTSHVERHNKTLRMQIRRFTRLTDGHSKLWRNHEAAVALFFAYYNFCRVHSTLKQTPAMAAKLTTHAWSVQELIEQSAGM